MTAFAAFAANSLLAAVWQGMLLTCLVALILRLTPGIPAAVRSGLWSAVFLLTIALHFVPGPPAPATHHADPAWSFALLAVWLSLSVYRVSQLFVGAMHLSALVRRAIPISSQIPSAGFRRPPILCTSFEVDRPSVIGFFIPRILIPPALYAALTPSELEHVLLHETSHLRRGDDWTNLLQKLALAVFPLNPVLLWVERRLCRERELACDDRVLAATQAPRAYALCLTSLAEHAALHRSLSLVLGAWQRQSELAARVHRILSRPAQTLTRFETGAVTLTILLGLGMGAHSLAGSPQMLSFAPTAVPPLIADTATDVPMRTVTSTMSTTGVGSTSSGRALLVKAIVPETPTGSARPLAAKYAVRSRHRQTHRVLRAAGRPDLQLSNQPRLILTVTQVRARSQVSSPYSPAFVPIAAYAVSMSDGWLIIQL